MRLFWENNIKAIETRDAELARQLIQIPKSANDLIFTKAENGSPILVLKNPNGQPIPLNDPRHPQQEAAQWVASLGNDCLRGAHVMLLGFGSGYYPHKLFQESDEQTVIWIIEPNLILLNAALQVADYTTLIQSSRVCLVGGKSEKEVVSQLFQGHFSHRMRAQGIRLTYSNITKQLYQHYIHALISTLSETIELDKLKFKTEELQGKKILGNIAKNLPLFVHGAPVLQLMGCTPGIPAFIIGAGPSLEEALPLIESTQNKVVKISVDTAHRILRQHGISSDLIVSLDFTKLNARHFEGIENDPAWLVAFPGIDPSILKKYENKAFFFEHVSSVNYDTGATPFFKLLQGFGSWGELISYGSTAHAAYHLARLMGCSPIVLVGNDLAFPSNKWYASGAMQNELQQPEREEETLLEVTANNGETVKTSGLYKIYLESFSTLIKQTAGVVYNTSLYGAKIDGCEYKPLEEILQSLPSHTIDHSLFETLHKQSFPKQSERIYNEIHQFLERCHRTHTEMKRFQQKMEKLKPEHRRFREKTKEILRGFSGLLSKDAKSFSLAIPLCPRTTTEFLGRISEVGAVSGQSIQQNEMVKERCLNFFSDLTRSLNTVIEILDSKNDVQAIINPTNER